MNLKHQDQPPPNSKDLYPIKSCVEHGGQASNIIFMKGQNGHVTLFWENGLSDLTDLGLKSSIRMSYA